LFAWARLSVIQTGSIAVIAFLIGDYATSIASLGPASSAIYACAVVLIFTLLNIAGLRQGKTAQMILTSSVVIGLTIVSLVGLALLLDPAPAPAPVPAGESNAAIGLAMVFVLLTYGGWNEAAYLSAEIRGNRRGIARALVLGIGVVTLIYLLVNLAMLGGLGLRGMA